MRLEGAFGLDAGIFLGRCGVFAIEFGVSVIFGRAGAGASDDDDCGEARFFVRGAWLELGAGVLLLLLGKGASFEDEFAEPWGVWERFGELGVGGGWVLGADGVGIVRGLLRGVWVCGCLEAGLKSGTYIGFGTRCGCVFGVFGFGVGVAGGEGGFEGAVVVAVAGQVVAFCVEGLEEELGDVGEGAGVAAVHASGGDVGEEFAEDEVDGDGIAEIAAEGEEFGADFRGGLELEEFAMVEEAELAGGFVEEHAAAAAVGELEVAAIFGTISGMISGMISGTISGTGSVWGGAGFFAVHVCARFVCGFPSFRVGRRLVGFWARLDWRSRV